MKASKIGLLFLILLFGSTLETAWRVRSHLGAGHWNWLAWGDNRFRGPSFSFDAQESRPLTGVVPVEVENAFGGVTIRAGAAGEVKVGLRKVVFLATEEKAREYASRIGLRTRTEAGALHIGTTRAELVGANDPGPEVGFETHLDIIVPPGTAVKVVNEHGAVEASDVARAEVTSSHDNVHLERVGGPASVDARHGEVRVSGVKGDLTITHKHGDVTIEDVEGKATVEMQHGELAVARVGSLVMRGAHGDVRAEAVKGDLEVTTQHAEVHALDVGGRAAIETSFQDVTAERVGGDARVRSEHGNVSLSDVRGAVDAQASFDGVTLARVGGPVVVEVRHGGVRGEAIEKGARIKASGDEVVLDGFRGPIEVEAERAGVRLVPSAPIADPVKVTAERGAIDLDVPPGSRFELQASAQHGEIAADVPDFSVTQTGAGRLAGRLGGGGNLVTLSSTHGDVRLRSTAAVAQKVN